MAVDPLPNGYSKQKYNYITDKNKTVKVLLTKDYMEAGASGGTEPEPTSDVLPITGILSAGRRKRGVFRPRHVVIWTNWTEGDENSRKVYAKIPCLTPTAGTEILASLAEKSFTFRGRTDWNLSGDGVVGENPSL